MKHPLTLAAALFTLVATCPLASQTVTTIGGTTSSPSRSALGKGNAIRIDKTVLLMSFEMYLDVPGTETLTFYMYQHHSPSGSFALKNTWKVNVNGTGKGAAWYSSGTIATPLLCGNSYILGVSWAGTATHHYSIGTCGQTIALGAWLSGSTVANPPAATESVACDRATYNQRFTTLPLTSVACVGKGCGAGVAPRLLASTPPKIGTTLTIDLVQGAASTPAAFLLVPAAVVKSPVPLFGCNLWIDLSQPNLTFTTNISSTGQATLPIPIPNNRIYVGTRLSAQAGVLRSALDITNAIDLTVY